MQNDGTNRDLENTRRGLYAVQREHGPSSAAGHHASNIIELMKLPNPPARLLKVQMDGLQRALAQSN